MGIYSPGEYGSIYNVETDEIVSAAEICDRVNDLEATLQFQVLELERIKDRVGVYRETLEIIVRNGCEECKGAELAKWAISQA